jgi:hypothetical protein
MPLIEEGATEKASQFVMLQKSVYNLSLRIKLFFEHNRKVKTIKIS